MLFDLVGCTWRTFPNCRWLRLIYWFLIIWSLNYTKRLNFLGLSLKLPWRKSQQLKSSFLCKVLFLLYSITWAALNDFLKVYQAQYFSRVLFANLLHTLNIPRVLNYPRVDLLHFHHPLVSFSDFHCAVISVLLSHCFPSCNYLILKCLILL